MNTKDICTSLSSLVRTTIGPTGMIKMLLTPVGSIVPTSDGNSIVRELDLPHPVAKTIAELSRTQAEEFGDGSTTVVVLVGEILQQLGTGAESSPEVARTLIRVLHDLREIGDKLAAPVTCEERAEMIPIIMTHLAPKYGGRYAELLCKFAIDAISAIAGPSGIDFMRYVRVESIPGGTVDQSSLVHGSVLHKDVLHSAMPRFIKDPKVVIMSSPLDWTKAESSMSLSIKKGSDYKDMLQKEVDYVRNMVEKLKAEGVNLVISEKGMSNAAIHELAKAGIAALRRVKKPDTLRVARVTGATIVHQIQSLTSDDIGCKATSFEVQKMGDEYFSMIESPEAKAVTVVLRGPSKTTLSELNRNLVDAMHVVRDVFMDPRVVPGGGAFEMALGTELLKKGRERADVNILVYEAVASALEVIARVICENAGASVIREITALRAKHNHTEDPSRHHYGIDSETGGAFEMALGTELLKKGRERADVNILVYEAVASALEVIARVICENAGASVIREITALRAKHNHTEDPSRHHYGIDSETGKVCDMWKSEVRDPFSVRMGAVTTSIEAASQLVRIDGIISSEKLE
ncbi:T-complex protein 1 subunit gamma [Aduncisulcus paluster]|uniref:T-complex protein 1 subunit gamma n=1 Tax=Aduncisulcus paluster TaxID=2918883 RepID=A0ABQ5K5T6_9EUKA|nr:T-complex protein 1 subunit gamma [Aduncisulcus paluster]